MAVYLTKFANKNELINLNNFLVTRTSYLGSEDCFYLIFLPSNTPFEFSEAMLNMYGIVYDSLEEINKEMQAIMTFNNSNGEGTKNYLKIGG